MFKIAGTPRISEYPTFNGKAEAWKSFKDHFEGTADAQGVGTVLEEHLDDTEILEDEEFITKSNFVYSVLKRQCAHGTAASKIRKYATSKDGYFAWQDLLDYYESQGNRETLVAEQLEQLTRLKLDYNSYGGLDQYIADFEEIVIQLEEAQEGLSDLQLKTMFLSGITDKDYRSVISNCRLDRERGYLATV